MSSQILKKPISAEFSIYLDLLRFAAAYFVLLFHMRGKIGPVELTRFIPNHGHDAVILFFVLSGYVIAATTDRKREKGLREYLLDRAARVYSVAIPTLVFSAILAVFFQTLLDPQGHYTLTDLTFDSFANLVFIAQSWSIKRWVFFNEPYWSLCYEVMYYLGFGVFTFMTGRTRLLGIVIVALLAGPKVLLLLPCWAIGVLAYTHRDRWILRTPIALTIGFILPPVVLILLHAIGFGPMVRGFSETILGTQKSYLWFSNDFLVDYVTAMLVAINLYSARYISFRFPVGVATFLKTGASMSFTLYLMHLPIIFLFANLAGAARESLLLFIFASIGIPLLCFVVSHFTEKKRPQLRKWLADVLP